MFKFFDFFISIIEMIVHFIGSLFEMFIYVFEFIFEGFTYAVSAVAYLPPFAKPFVLAVIGFSVVMFIINR